AEALGVALGAPSLAVVAKLDLAAHARAGGHGQRARLDVAVDDARLEQLDPLGVLDVADQLTGDADHAGLYVPFQARGGIERHVTLDLHVALELAGDAHVTGTDDLALDGQIGGDVRLLHVVALRGRRRRRAARRFGGNRGHGGALRGSVSRGGGLSGARG